MQLAAAILFFYVFGLAALLMTWYAGRVVAQYIQEGQREQRKKKAVKPEVEGDSVKLHVSGGLLEVNRLPDHEQDDQA